MNDKAVAALQLIHGIAIRNRHKGCRGRSGWDWEVALHDKLEAIEISAQHLWTVGVRDRTKHIFDALAAPLQPDFAVHFRVANPLGAASRTDQKRVAADDQQIHRSGIVATAFAPDDLEQGVVARGEPSADQPSVEAIEGPLKRSLLQKLGRRKLSHDHSAWLNR